MKSPHVALCLKTLELFNNKTAFISLAELTTLTTAKDEKIITQSLLSILRRLTPLLKKDSSKTRNFFSKWTALESQLQQDPTGQEVIFFATLYSDLDFALRDLTINEIQMSVATSHIQIQPIDPLVETLCHYSPVYLGVYTAMRGIMQVPLIKEKLRLDDPKINEYFYPEIFTGIVAIHVTLCELYTAFVLGEIPYNVLYAATQAIVANLVDNDNPLFKQLADELVPLSLFVGIKMGYDPQLPVFYHSTLSYLFTRLVRSGLPQFVQTIKSSSLWHQVTEKCGELSWTQKMWGILQGVTSPQLSSYFNSQFLYLGSLWLFNQLLSQETLSQYVNSPRPK
jgi:hypothetical protein